MANIEAVTKLYSPSELADIKMIYTEMKANKQLIELQRGFFADDRNLATPLARSREQGSTKTTTPGKGPSNSGNF